MKLRPLTPDEFTALRDFAAARGRYWKRDLHDAWMHASEPGLLQSLRNSHGPAWLHRFRLSDHPATNCAA